MQPEASWITGNCATILETPYARHTLGCSDDRILCHFGWLRAFLRPREVEENAMGLESLIMIAVSVLTGVYLLYALLRPEKF